MPTTPEGARYMANFERDAMLRELRDMPPSEKDFSEAVIDMLCRTGWSRADYGDYVRSQALKVNSLVAYIRKTQHEEWAKIERLYGQQAREQFLRCVCDELEPHGERGGVVNVLRHGIRMEPGALFHLCGFKPEPEADPSERACYEANCFEVVQTLRYGTTSEDADNRVGAALFINGIPVVTMELKNSYVGQHVEDAVARYKREHSSEELIFRPNYRSIMHFALDCDDVEICTWLAGGESHFRPFDLDDGANNLDNVTKDGYRTEFLPKKVLAPDALLEIIQSRVRVEYDSSTHEMCEIVFPG